ncbi:MAG: hybrid sensor histidine kinase/response regulator [Chloroflexota bacterium]
MANPDKTILVIDDESFLLVGIKALLERAGYRVLVAEESPAGVQMAQEQHPDLIVCDVMMPWMDGFKVRETLNADPQTRDIPFLFLSARTSQTDKLKGLDSGADDYITKPFDHRELLARISAILNRYAKGREAARWEIDRQIALFQQEISNNISHELRTPMTQILFSLDIILRNKYDDPEDLKMFVEIALSQSYRLNSIIDDLIFLNGYDRGTVNSMRQKVNIEQDFLDPIRMRQEFYADKNLRVQIKADPGVVVHAPKREFRQAVVHLVDNAFKFSPPTANILIDLEPNEIGGCVLTVTDDGVGIPSHLHEEVFKRHFQASQGDTRAYNGLGVGLTIARAVAQALGGNTVVIPVERGCQAQMTVAPGPVDIP